MAAGEYMIIHDNSHIIVTLQLLSRWGVSNSVLTLQVLYVGGVLYRKPPWHISRSLTVCKRYRIYELLGGVDREKGH